MYVCMYVCVLVHGYVHGSALANQGPVHEFETSLRPV